MHKKIVASIAMTLAIATAHAGELLPGDPAKGKKLVQEKCDACHARMLGDAAKIYTRPDRRVKSIEALMGQVAACNQQLDARLSKEDRDNIVIFLNQTYYRF